MTLRSIAVVLCAAALGGCSKDAVQTITAPVSGAQIKFFNFAVATPPGATPAVNFYADNAKMTAITSGTGQESTLGTGTGSVGNGGLYSVIPPGPYTVTGRVAATTDNGLAIATLAVSLADGKYYSMYMSGYYNTTSKTTDAFTLEDPFPAQIDYTVAYVRFVNASANASPMTLYAKNTTSGVEAAVGGAAAYKSAGNFVTVQNGVYDLSTRNTGSATNVVTRTGISFSAGRVYTIAAFGDVTVTSSTAANRVRLDNTTNR